MFMQRCAGTFGMNLTYKNSPRGPQGPARSGFFRQGIIIVGESKDMNTITNCKRLAKELKDSIDLGHI